MRLFTIDGSACPVPRAGIVTFDDAPIIGTASVELHHMLAGYEWLSAQGCDVIHDHTLAGPLYGPATTSVPVVTTNHGPFTSPELASIYRAVQTNAAIVAISHDQARDAAEQLVDIAAVIHHGLDTDSIPVGCGTGGYLLFLGRMAPEKGAHRAIAAARSTGQRLVIAAKMREPAELAYFRNEISPHLGDDVQFVGEVSGADKWALLGRATALINPITWSEPFGLVMIEALADRHPGRRLPSRMRRPSSSTTTGPGSSSTTTPSSPTPPRLPASSIVPRAGEPPSSASHSGRWSPPTSTSTAR